MQYWGSLILDDGGTPHGQHFNFPAESPVKGTLGLSCYRRGEEVDMK